MRATRGVALAVLASAILGCGLFGAEPPPGPTVLIQTPYPGVSPVDVEPIVITQEEALRGVAGVDSVFATAFEGLAHLEVRFASGVDGTAGRLEIRDALDRALLPADAEVPMVFELHTAPAVAFVVPEPVAERLCDDLATEPGVLGCVTRGQRTDRTFVEVAPEQLQRFGLGVDALLDAHPSDDLRTPDGEILLRVPDRRAVDPTDWPVGPLRLGDIATVRTEAVSDVIVVAQGEPAAVVEVRHGPELDAGVILERAAMLSPVAPRPLKDAARIVLAGPESDALPVAVETVSRAIGPPLAVEFGTEATLWYAPLPVDARADLATLVLPGVQVHWPTPWTTRVVLTGPRDEDPAATVATVGRALLELPTVSDVRLPDPGESSLDVRIDRKRAAEAGVSTADIARALRLMHGEVRGADDVRFVLAGEPDLTALTVTGPSGASVPVAQIAELVLIGPQPPIERLDGQRVHTLPVSLQAEDAVPDMSSLPIPEGWTVRQL